MRNSLEGLYASAPETIDPAWAWQPFEPTTAGAVESSVGGCICFAAPRSAPQRTNRSRRRAESLVCGRAGRAARRKTQTTSAGKAKNWREPLLSTGDARQLAAWWVYVMLHTPHPLLEQMTLFWHGHFATSAEKVTDAELMLEQNRLLRRHAMGDFRPFVQEISRDPAMLVYLDSATNRKAHPNENYARELMELFCLGEGNYSEKDVQELARCFTGWEIKLGRVPL